MGTFGVLQHNRKRALIITSEAQPERSCLPPRAASRAGAQEQLAYMASAAGVASSWRTARRARAPEPFPWDVGALLRRCGKPEALPMGGVILRAALTDSEQQWLYEALHVAVRTAQQDGETCQKRWGKTKLFPASPRRVIAAGRGM